MMDRPYCLQELIDLESELHDKYRLSSIFAQHYPCGHKYRVKKGGRKEQFILDSLRATEDWALATSQQSWDGQNRPFGARPEGVQDSALDDQTCSVCFKLRTSIDSNKLTESVIDNIKLRDDNIIDLRDINIDFLKQKTHFYKWLFQHDY
jgi:hypothetical protein